MEHTYITVVVLQGSDIRIVGKIPATHSKAFEESLKQGLELTFPIYDTRIIVTKDGKKTILAPK
jgi:hypothetical protein